MTSATLEDGGPAWATWVGVVGALVALVVGFRGHLALERTAALASALVLLPTYVHGFANWAPSEARPPNPLSDGLLAAVRERVPTGRSSTPTRRPAIASARTRRCACASIR